MRVEPFVLPKRSLTGDNTERVDTMVLQVLYEITADADAIFIGQQMDVFIEMPQPQERPAEAGAAFFRADRGVESPSSGRWPSDESGTAEPWWAAMHGGAVAQ